MTYKAIDPRIVAAFDKSHDFSFEKSCVMLCYVGSKSHNTYVPSTDKDAIDDVDLMGVVIPPEDYTIGLKTFEHWTFKQDELDVVVYSMDKFVRLLVKSNPNVLGTLWMKPSMYLKTSLVWNWLVNARTHFATKAAFGAFAGYAQGQQHRMTALTPEIQAEMAQLEAELETAGWHLQDVMDKRSVPMPKGMSTEDANTKADRLRKLRARYHAAYQGEKRRNLVMKHSYDTKNAAHLVRLLRMCTEFLATGEMQVWRVNDAETYRAIKRGEWTLERVKEEADSLYELAKVAKELSTLPKDVDIDAVSKLLVTIMQEHYGWYE